MRESKEVIRTEWLEWFTPVNTFLCAVITSIAGVTVTVVLKSANDTKRRLQDHKEQLEKMNRAQLTVLRRDLRRSYEHYILGDRPIPETHYKELHEEHLAYRGAHGNGTESKWWGGIEAKGAATTQEVVEWLKEHPGETIGC